MGSGHSRRSITRASEAAGRGSPCRPRHEQVSRPARAGAAGIAISLCDPSERAYLHDIEKLTARQLIGAAAEPAAPAAHAAAKLPPRARRRRRWSRQHQQQRRAA